MRSTATLATRKSAKAAPKLKCAWIPAPLYERVQAFRVRTGRTAIGVITIALDRGLIELEGEEVGREGARAEGRGARGKGAA